MDEQQNNPQTENEQSLQTTAVTTESDEATTAIEQPKTKLTNSPKNNPTVAILVAVIVAAVLVIVGILAYKSSDVTTDVDSDASQTDLLTENELLTEAAVQQELDSIETELQKLEEELEDFTAGELSDESLNLE